MIGNLAVTPVFGKKMDRGPWRTDVMQESFAHAGCKYPWFREVAEPVATFLWGLALRDKMTDVIA